MFVDRLSVLNDSQTIKAWQRLSQIETCHVLHDIRNIIILLHLVGVDDQTCVDVAGIVLNPIDPVGRAPELLLDLKRMEKLTWRGGLIEGLHAGFVLDGERCERQVVRFFAEVESVVIREAESISWSARCFGLCFESDARDWAFGVALTRDVADSVFCGGSGGTRRVAVRAFVLFVWSHCSVEALAASGTANSLTID